MLEGKIINLRLVEEEDAEFILNLRNTKEISKFISPTNITLEEQKKWIKLYKDKENRKEEFYFIVEDKNKNSCGTVRVYKIDYFNKVATWGSFILSSLRPDGASNEVIELSLKFILEDLKLEKVNLDVRKNNKKAIYIYEKNNFIRVAEDQKNNNYYYSFKKDI